MILVKKDSKDKIRIVHIEYKELSPNNYCIYRTSGILNGKQISQPDIIINKGLVKRTVLEQTILMYNSRVCKYLDKGYKKLTDIGYSDNLDHVSESDLILKLGGKITDSNGNIKPMLAKSSDSVKSEVFNSKYYTSTKLDGVRCTLWYDSSKNCIKTSSRGGKNYDVPSTHIRNDQSICTYLKNNPNVILDGELYIHGTPLPIISGLCRKHDFIEDHKNLKFHVYDIVSTTQKFEDRLSVLNKLKTEINSEYLVIVEHVETNSWKEIEDLHNKYVQNGYEGCVARDATAVYKYSGRDNRMIKVKKFEDSEFEIIGLEDGLRDEDLCFVLKTKSGDMFKAKPVGTRELKDSYRKDINNIIGKMGTVKYFGFTPYGIPNLPVFKTVRNYE